MKTLNHYLEGYEGIYEQNKNKTDWSLKFKRILEEMKRSPTVVSKLAGFSHENIFSIMRKQNIPSFYVLEDTVRYLHVNPEWLIAGNEDADVLTDRFRSRDTDEHIAERVRSLMEGKPKRAFANKAGIDYSILMKLDGDRPDDKKGTGEVTIHKIADMCNVGFEWLFCGDEKAKDNPCTSSMIEWLKKHPEARKNVFVEMEMNMPEEDKNLQDRAAAYLEEMSDDATSGERIREMRRIYDCSLRDFAAITGVSKSTICNWENNRNKPDDFILRRISESLNIGKNWILYGDKLSLRWPCDKRMEEYLKERPDLRKNISEQMSA